MDLKFISITLAVLSLLIILACGGGGDNEQSTGYPLTKKLSLNAINNDALPAHFLTGTETYDASNRVPAVTGITRDTTNSWTWSSATAVQNITVTVGRNGADITSQTVSISGAEASNLFALRATFDGTNVALAKIAR